MLLFSALLFIYLLIIYYFCTPLRMREPGANGYE